MNPYQTFSAFVKQIISSIQNTGIASVKTLKETITTHTYEVKVTNPTTKVDVKGSVTVANQQKLEKQIASVEKAIQEVKKTLPDLKNVKVGNFPKFPAFPKFPDFPKEMKVTNLSDKTEVTNLREITDALNELSKAVGKIKLDPEIRVNAPVIPAPIVNVPTQPAPIVTVNEREIDLSKLDDLLDFLKTRTAAKPLPVRLSDGKAYYKAVDRLIEAVANTSTMFMDNGGFAAQALVNRNHEVQVTVNDTWDFNDSEKVSSTLTYFGEESVDGLWRVRKVMKNSTFTSIRHATVRNNAGISTYDDAWAARSSLEYGRVGEAL